MEKEKLRPLYSELQGYLSQAPDISDRTNVYIYTKSIWEQYNETIKLLNQLSDKDYSRFCVTTVRLGGGSIVLPLVAYRQKLGGLINSLHAEYFSNEQAPFSGSPNMVVTQSQQQNQTFHVQMLLEIQSKIDEKVLNYKEGSKEKSFLQKIKSSLSSVSGVAQLLNLFITTTKEFDLNLDTISSILS